MKYAIIPKLGQSPVQTSEQRAKGISKEYLKLSLPTIPTDNITEYAIATISNAANDQEWAVAYDPEYILNVQQGFNTGYLFTLYGQSVTGQERSEINARINAAVGGTIKVGDITPSSWTLYTYEDMVNMGWIVEDLI